ncbi:MAG: solute-binding protein [Candidatus Eisenbacteria bacterium]|uniref:Solute-binding protein n=1 Tax=Eiseniibacteriota bacterium TaxID=2212470 RepID=A0A849SKP7_UNCEI|nr:solute-binding protein [Candidatus Eisenbacteria bacterium]
MIDSIGFRFLDSRHFGVRARAFRLLRWAPVLFLPFVAALLTGCSRPAGERNPEETITGGSISIVSPREVLPLVRQAAVEFEARYPEAHIRVEEGTSSDAVRALFGATADLAILTRDLGTDERAAAVRGRLALEGYAFARDAIVMVVNPRNSVENLSVPDVRKLYAGTARSWKEFGGADAAIEPSIRTDAPDLVEAFAQQALDNRAVAAPSLRAASDSEVVALVARRPGAVGYVTLGARREGTRDLRLSRLDGLPYWSPDLEAIHEGDYPLTRSLHVYARESGPPLAKGFITFMTSREGQSLVHAAGLLPTAIPLRFVRRSPMKGSH